MNARVVVITGASAGLGRAIAREFGAEGAKVALLARGREGLEAARREVDALGGEGLAIPLDVSHADAVERAAADVERRWGHIDVWVNNAMVSVFSPVSAMKPEEYKRVTDVTYLGYVYGTLAALPRMKRRNQGVIIQIGSALAHRSIPLQSAYCAAKHAINGFSESLRVELLHEKSAVQVCRVNLPAMNTTQFTWSRSKLPKLPQPVPPIYQPELIAKAVRHVSLHPRRELNVAFPTQLAVASEKISPAVGDAYLALTGYDSQMTKEPASPDRRDNLWEPLPGDHGARGPFSDRAHDTSLSLWANLNRAPLLAAAGAVAVLGYFGWKKSA